MPPFHLAFPVTSLAEARAFYGALLGCPDGRSAEDWALRGVGSGLGPAGPPPGVGLWLAGGGPPPGPGSPEARGPPPPPIPLPGATAGRIERLSTSQTPNAPFRPCISSSELHPA